MKKMIVCTLALLMAVGNAWAATSGNVRVTATVGTPTDTVTISLSAATVDFGSVTASLSQYRFRKPLTTDTQLQVGWDSIVPYEIRVFTDNGVGPIAGGNTTDLTNSQRLGFIRSGTAVTANRLPLKLWCPNFSGNAFVSTALGPTLGALGNSTTYAWKGYNLNNDTIFDPDNPQVFPAAKGDPDVSFSETTLGQDINSDGDTADTIVATWTGDTPATKKRVSEGPSLSYIREKDTMADSTTDFTTAPKTRLLLAWNQPGLNAARGTPEGADLGKPFPACFGADLVGVTAGTYDSNNNGDVPIVSGQTAVDGVIFEILPY